MPKKSGDAAPSKKVLRESDSPIVEEYKKNLLNWLSYGFSLPDMTTRVSRRTRVCRRSRAF
jgi:hypothetical protein